MQCPLKKNRQGKNAIEKSKLGGTENEKNALKAQKGRG
jgi:hypothetical protein